MNTGEIVIFSLWVSIFFIVLGCNLHKE